MALEMDGRFREEREDSALERQDTLIDLVGTPSMVPSDDWFALEST
jgi:hypothetical protein